MKKRILKILIPTTLLIAALYTIGISCGPPPCESQTWYQDLDSDGYGNPEVTEISCYQPEGYVSDNTDCNDQNVKIYPGAEEVVGDGIDANCDGSDEH